MYSVQCTLYNVHACLAPKIHNQRLSAPLKFTVYLTNIQCTSFTLYSYTKCVPVNCGNFSNSWQPIVLGNLYLATSLATVHSIQKQSVAQEPGKRGNLFSTKSASVKVVNPHSAFRNKSSVCLEPLACSLLNNSKTI